MHPAALLRTPISAIGGSSNRYVCRQAGLSRFSCFPNGNQSLEIPARTQLKPLRISCRVGFKDSNGIEPITVNKSLDNLAKLYSINSCEQQSEDRSVYKQIEKLIADDRMSIDAINSPKQNLGEKWRQYQGSNNWEGMLEPLDENLRREIVKYGDFVQASYNAMDFQQEIARLGRRDIVVSYRGTVTPLEWAENLNAGLTPAVNKNKSKRKRKTSNFGRCQQPQVESGFWNLFTTENPEGQSASDQVVNEVRRLVQLYEGEEISITITGHSLGAALAVLTASQIGEELNSNENAAAGKAKVPVTVFSFGGPRVGNRAFGHTMEETGCKVLRIVNTHDVITKVPGLVINEQPMQQQQRSKNVVVSKFMDVLDSMPWAYLHVGTELRVNNKHSPYLKPDADMSCCHDLEAYLHLVDGYLSSNCPFRSTAKRDIVRLLTNQKSNVLKPNKKAALEDGGKALSQSKSFSRDRHI